MPAWSTDEFASDQQDDVKKSKLFLNEEFVVGGRRYERVGETEESGGGCCVRAPASPLPRIHNHSHKTSTGIIKIII